MGRVSWFGLRRLDCVGGEWVGDLSQGMGG